MMIIKSIIFLVSGDYFRHLWVLWSTCHPVAKPIYRIMKKLWGREMGTGARRKFYESFSEGGNEFPILIWLNALPRRVSTRISFFIGPPSSLAVWLPTFAVWLPALQKTTESHVLWFCLRKWDSSETKRCAVSRASYPAWGGTDWEEWNREIYIKRSPDSNRETVQLKRWAYMMTSSCSIRYRWGGWNSQWRL